MLTNLNNKFLINKDFLFEENIKNKIRDELKKLEYNFSYIGTKYLLDSIYILYCIKIYYNFSLEKDIYPVIANKYGESANNIKCNIVNATDKMFFDCDEKTLRKYLEDYSNSKPDPKKVIRAVIKNIL